MTDLQDVIGLLYRADWTRLSMSVDVHLASDRDLVMSRVRATRPPWSPDRPVRIFREDPEGGAPTWDEVSGEEPRGFHAGRVRLLMAPGGHYRQEYGVNLHGRSRG